MENTDILNNTRKFVVICAKGGRSRKVAEYLVEQGMGDVLNVVGGMEEWKGEVEGSNIKVVDNTVLINDHLEIGDTWDYLEELSDIEGFEIDIPELVKSGPVFIIFYRGYEHG